jgi:hypothetical protein
MNYALHEVDVAVVDKSHNVESRSMRAVPIEIFKSLNFPLIFILFRRQDE